MKQNNGQGIKYILIVLGVFLVSSAWFYYKVLKDFEPVNLPEVDVIPTQSQKLELDNLRDYQLDYPYDGKG